MDVRGITVVYDNTCELCRRCRTWLEASAQLVPIAFVAANDKPAVRTLGIDPGLLPVGDELIVVATVTPGNGRPVWVGADAFITCLWALADHRHLAGRLQRPSLRPVAKAAFHALSLGRGTISSVLSETAPIGPGLECAGACRPVTPR